MFKKKNSIEQQQVKAVNPMIILIVFLLIAAIATYIIPAGSFDRIADETTGYETVDPDSYHRVEQNPIKPFDVFKSFHKGLSGSASLIFFILIVGGSLQVIQDTGAGKPAAHYDPAFVRRAVLLCRMQRGVPCLHAADLHGLPCAWP